MKRFALLGLLVLGFVTLVSAQSRNNWNWNLPQSRVPQVTSEKVTVSGDLTIVQGSLAVKSGDITYLTMGLRQFIGFIDGLKDGARVSLEGNAITRSSDANTKFLMVTKLTIAGKDYDVGRSQATAPAQPTLPNRPQAQPRPQPIPQPQLPQFQYYPNFPNRRR